MSWLIRLALGAVIGMVLALSPAKDARAKVVGVLFDDSGSMKPYAGFPALMFQLLAATLRQGDTLLVVRMSDFEARYRDEATGLGPNMDWNLDIARRLPVGSVAERRRTIQTIRTWPAETRNPRHGSVNTPYAALDLLLQATLTQMGPEEPGYLIALTDGAFNEYAKQPANTLRDAATAAIRAYGARYRAKDLQAFFVGFDHRDTETGQTTADAIEAQNIGQTLVATFPPGPPFDASAFRVVKNFGALQSALVEMVRAVNESNPETRPDVIQRSAREIQVSAPFSIQRVTVLDLGPKGQPVARASMPDAEHADIYAHEGRMEAPDRFEWRDGRKIWRGVVSIVDPQLALEADTPHRIMLDAPRGEQAVLLLEAEVVVDWRLVDAEAGQEMTPDANGVVTIAAGRDYEVRASLLDYPRGAGSTPRTVKLSRLPQDARFRLARVNDSTGDVRNANGAIDRTSDQVRWTLRYDRPIRERLSVSVVMPGLISKRSKTILLDAKDFNVDTRLEVTPGADCANCAQGVIDPVLRPDADWIEGARIGIVVDGGAATPPNDGPLKIELGAPLPEGVRLLDPEGGVIARAGDASAELPFQLGAPTALTVQIDGGALAGAKGAKLELMVTPPDPLRGSAAVEVLIDPRLPQAEIVAAGNTASSDPGAAGLTLPRDGFTAGQAFFVRIEGAVDPVDPTHLSATAADFNLAIEPGRAAGELQLTPTVKQPWLCCFLASGAHPVTLAYVGPRQTSSLRTMNLTVRSETLIDRLLICLPLILAVLAVVWLFAAIAGVARSARFPKKARLLVYQNEHRAEARWDKFRPTPIPRSYVMPFIWPFRLWHDARRIYGMKLEARHGSVALLPGAYENLARGSESRPLARFFPDGKGEPVELYWGQKVRERGGGARTFEFCEDVSRA